jgi:hypothetical protein
MHEDVMTINASRILRIAPHASAMLARSHHRARHSASPFTRI